MNTVFLALGSNIGDREYYLNQAVDACTANQAIEVVAVSAYINTEAVSTITQPDYLNAVIELKTILSLRELFEFTLSVEKLYGRASKGTSDPRTLDIDILLYNDVINTDEDLIVPHPLFHERAFVLEPFCDISPSTIHPLLNLSVQELYDLIRENSYSKH